MASPWNEAVFWPAARAVGMLTRAFVALPGCPAATEAWVEYVRPDVEVGSGAGLSSEHSIEYQHADLPTLAEGVELILEHVKNEVASRVKYRVRVPPVVETNGTGYFRVALLTREDC